MRWKMTEEKSSLIFIGKIFVIAILILLFASTESDDDEDQIVEDLDAVLEDENITGKFFILSII